MQTVLECLMCHGLFYNLCYLTFNVNRGNLWNDSRHITDRGVEGNELGVGIWDEVPADVQEADVHAPIVETDVNHQVVGSADSRAKQLLAQSPPAQQQGNVDNVEFRTVRHFFL